MADVTQKLMSASYRENSRQEAGWPSLADRSVFDVATCNISMGKMDAGLPLRGSSAGASNSSIKDCGRPLRHRRGRGRSAQEHSTHQDTVQMEEEEEEGSY